VPRKGWKENRVSSVENLLCYDKQLHVGIKNEDVVALVPSDFPENLSFGESVDQVVHRFERKPCKVLSFLSRDDRFSDQRLDSPLLSPLAHSDLSSYRNTMNKSRRPVSQTVTLSPKYQVVIPKGIRESLRLRPGQKMCVFENEGRIEMIPEPDLSTMEGSLKGIRTDIEREEDRV